jgi:hypothetical protein
MGRMARRLARAEAAQVRHGSLARIVTAPAAAGKSAHVGPRYRQSHPRRRPPSPPRSFLVTRSGQWHCRPPLFDDLRQVRRNAAHLL